MTDISQLRIRAAETKRHLDQGVMTEKAVDGTIAREIVFGRFVIEPDVALPAHIHSADTIAYCIRGSCSFRVGDNLDQEFEIGPGDYAYIPADTLHTETTGNDGVELIFARDRQGGETTMVEEQQ